jgi:hypothetical protein
MYVIFILVLVKDFIILGNPLKHEDVMGPFHVCFLGPVHVFVKYPHCIGEIKPVVGEINQLANISMI